MCTLNDEIVSYRATQKNLIAKFYFWQVEALLNQASNLVDKCIEELREYNSLDFAFNQLDVSLRLENKLLYLYSMRINNDLLERDAKIADLKQRRITSSQKAFDESFVDAETLNQIEGEQGQGGVGWLKAGQNLNEKRIEQMSRLNDQEVADLQSGWSILDKDFEINSFKCNSDSLKDREHLRNQGEAFDLLTQRDKVALRLFQNYKDCLNRWEVAKTGLNNIYGMSVDAKILEPLEVLNGYPNDTIITALAIAIRTGIEHLVAYQQRDQAFTKILSVKSILSDDEWKKINNSDATCHINIFLEPVLFKRHYNVRLRGIGASLIGEGVGQIPWIINVGVPKNGIFIRNSADGVKTDCFEIDQKDIPKCLIGRVENKLSFRQIEICGLISLMNASPIGNQKDIDDWSMDIEKPKSIEEKFSKIEDILIELKLVGVPVPNS